MSTSCSSICNEHKETGKYKHTSFLSLLLIIILPNCPFCIMAYTSAITMCGGPDMYLAENNWASFIPIILSILIISMIAINRRGRRTYIAILLTILGSLFIIGVHQLYLGESFYYIGTFLLFFGIWVNSSFLYTFFTIKSLFLSSKVQ